ncbi:MAG: hypothetical protein AAF236_08220 [Verrucomicrobiota bacterium]
MILDTIIVFLISIFSATASAVSLICVPIVNLLLAGIEMLVSLFISGFKLGRLSRRKRERRPAIQQIMGLVPVIAVLGAIAWLVIWPQVGSRRITLLAPDGHTLPLTGVVVETDSSDQHIRSDNSGGISIPRFSTRAVEINDPRYVSKRWESEDIGPELIVERTLLGSGLDRFAGELLKPAE